MFVGSDVGIFNQGIYVLQASLSYFVEGGVFAELFRLALSLSRRLLAMFVVKLSMFSSTLRVAIRVTLSAGLLKRQSQQNLPLTEVEYPPLVFLPLGGQMFFTKFLGAACACM